MSNRGFLVPDRYVFDVPNAVDMNLSSIFWGFSLAIALFSAIRAARQSNETWKRKHKLTAYVVMIWVEWIASMIIGALAWCYQRQYVRASFQLLFVTACFWSIQIQLLMQIIINRIAILMTSSQEATRLKWAVFGLLLLVNISVLVIWIPAQLQISSYWVRINDVWDRCEKVIFCLVDLSLNLRFVYLVRTRLISHGLSKYTPLFHFNCVMIGFSISLDIVLIGLMSLPSKLVYLQFHPVAYLGKLFIEMNMADLIAKVAKASNPSNTQRHSQRLRGYSIHDEKSPNERIYGTCEMAAPRRIAFAEGGAQSQGSLKSGPNYWQIQC
ncbi:hypothetical protein BGZ63DRAFT_424924 [Mariannaea sp. PMI_226]|nr:hypothetical protein BGZ63DRAFT_424924 [Mariannaea sp. PMI_226]